VVATPVLPRFLRPGDQFDAGLIGRIVEGPEGAGRAALSADNLTVDGAGSRTSRLADKRPARVDFPSASPSRNPATKRRGCASQRNADKAGDAVEITLPIRPDRPPVRQHQIADLMPGQAIDQPPPPCRSGRNPCRFGDLGDRPGAGPADRRPRLSVALPLRLHRAADLDDGLGTAPLRRSRCS
jgi:hypothetical protein